MARVSLVVFRLLLRPYVLQMCDSGPIGIDEIDKQGGVDTGMTLGSCHMILLIYSHARENAAVYGVFWVVSGL